MFPLAMARSGQPVLIRKINGRDDTKRHLANLGFVEGEDITVVTENGGNLIINVKDTRIALNRAMATRIMIETRSGSEHEDTKECGHGRNRHHTQAAW